MNVKLKSIKISENLHRRLKGLAAKRCVTIQALVAKLLSLAIVNGSKVDG